MKYIILEDDAETLAHVYMALKQKETDPSFLLIKCDVNPNCSEEIDKKEIDNVKRYILEKSSTLEYNDLPSIHVMKTTEELLNSAIDQNLYQADDILVMDITLFDKKDEGENRAFNEYASVRLAQKLTIDMQIIPPENIRFYTRATSKSDPKEFCRQTEGRWRVPVLRPQDFDADGVEEEVEIFVNKVLGKEK